MSIPAKSILAVILAAALAGLPTAGRTQDPLQVVVDIKAVSLDVARNISVEASKIPLTIQAPLEVAATVCGIPATTLGAQGGSGAAGCQAKTSSPALEHLVQEKLRQ